MQNDSELWKIPRRHLWPLIINFGLFNSSCRQVSWTSFITSIIRTAGFNAITSETNIMHSTKRNSGIFNLSSFAFASRFPYLITNLSWAYFLGVSINEELLVSYNFVRFRTLEFEHVHWVVKVG